jgi:ribonuclease PH
MILPLKFDPNYEAAEQTFGNLYDATGKLVCCDIRQADAEKLLAVLNAAASLAVSSATMPQIRGNPVVLAIHATALIDAVMPCVQSPSDISGI